METSILQPGIEIQPLHSNILNQDLVLFIKLPSYYETSNATYPVLYTTDANRSFTLYSTMSLIYETDRTDTNDIVIVGMGYRLDGTPVRGLAQWAAWRTRDLTPVSRKKIDEDWEVRLTPLLGGEKPNVQSGGAAQFRQALAEEVIPFIETNYRVSRTDRGLAGYSYGGLFTLYVLFHTPETFARYLAGSPTMWKELFEYEETYAALHSDLRTKVFVTRGGLETDQHEPVQRLVDRLRSRGYPGLELRSQVFEGEGHSSAYAASVAHALAVLYNEKWLAG